MQAGCAAWPSLLLFAESHDPYFLRSGREPGRSSRPTSAAQRRLSDSRSLRASSVRLLSICEDRNSNADLLPRLSPGDSANPTTAPLPPPRPAPHGRLGSLPTTRGGLGFSGPAVPPSSTGSEKRRSPPENLLPGGASDGRPSAAGAARGGEGTTLSHPERHRAGHNPGPPYRAPQASPPPGTCRRPDSRGARARGRRGGGRGGRAERGPAAAAGAGRRREVGGGAWGAAAAAFT